ncbi:MAG: cofactor-independent phosphoglycerate mutase [Thermodesulfobacteriota bacterium]
MAKTKLLFLVADGMGDYPVRRLGGKTPLEAAETPHMDALAACCTAGLARTVPLDMPPGSDVANMSLLGFDPAAHHTGRGPIEAAAQGLDLNPDDLVWRLNLVTVSEPGPDGRMLDYSAGHIPTEQAAALIARLQQALGNAEFAFHPGVQYRHLLVQSGGAAALEARIHVRPPHDITDQAIAPDLKEIERSPGLFAIFTLAARILAAPGNPSKANSVWPWGQGRPLSLPRFREAFGLRGAVISAVDLVRGLGRAAGMRVLDVEGATGLLDTNYEGKVQAALDYLLGRGGDFVFLHVEAPDECGHAGDPVAKTEAVRRFDARIVGPLRAALKDTDAALLVCCDHLTPVRVRTHTPEPVPFLLHHPSCSDHRLPAFTEKHAASTGLLLEQGHALLPYALQRLGRGA